MYNEILRSGKTARTVAHVHRVLHGMLKDGERLGYLVRNVASLVTPPQPGPSDWTVLTRDQLRLFLAKASDTTYGALWALLASIEMRIGEGLALQWDNFDFTAGTARIENTLSWRRGSWYLDDPKTYSSTRTIAVRESVTNSLNGWAEVQAQWKNINPEWATEGFVFTNGGAAHCIPPTCSGTISARSCATPVSPRR